MSAESSEEQINKAHIGRLHKAKKEISKIVCDLDKVNNQELNNELFKDFCDHNSQSLLLDKAENGVFSRLDKAKVKIFEIVCQLDKENNKELHNELFKDFCNQNSQENYSNKNKKALRWGWGILFIIILIVIFGASCYVATKVGVNGKILNEGNSSQIFLAFVVALASYLASASRETVKALSSSVGDARIRYKKNIFMMAIAEIHLVIISVLTISSFVFGPRFISKILYILNNILNLKKNIPFSTEIILFIKDIQLNSFLVSYLLVTMLWLAFINFIVWWNTSPWDVYKPPSPSK